MYKNALEADLKTIFKVPRVDIGRAVENCIEQGVLCVDIENARMSAQDGKATARVTGYIGIRATMKERKSGYLIKKINEADGDLTKRFWFSPSEENSSFSPADFELKGYKLRFTYFYREEYNPARGPLAGASWRVHLNDAWHGICRFFK